MKRRDLVSRLHEMGLDDEASREVEAAWMRVAEERLAAFGRGEETALDGPRVLEELRARYRR